MSTHRFIGRAAFMREKDPGPAEVTLEKDRASLCSFTFADGRRCRTPHGPGHAYLCAFHARKEAQSLAVENLGRDISYFFSGEYLSACDLSSALGRLFATVAQGHVKPRTATTLAYLGQTLVQTIQLAEHEYTNAFGGNAWRERVRSSVDDNSNRQLPSTNQDPGQATTSDTATSSE